MPEPSEVDKFRAKLDLLSDEDIQRNIARGDYGKVGWKLNMAEVCLAQRIEAKQAAAQTRHEAREDEAIVLARRADGHATKADKRAVTANRIACFAAVMAVVAIFISLIK